MHEIIPLARVSPVLDAMLPRHPAACHLLVTEEMQTVEYARQGNQVRRTI